MPASDHEAVLQVIEQLSKYVEQLTTCTQDPELDVGALNRACADRLSRLQQLMPPPALRSTDNAAGEELDERSTLVLALQSLEVKTQECIDVLQNALEHVGEKIEQYRNRQTAIRAYDGNR